MSYLIAALVLIGIYMIFSRMFKGKPMNSGGEAVPPNQNSPRVYLARETMNAIENNSTGWRRLFADANDLITEIRLTTEKK